MCPRLRESKLARYPRLEAAFQYFRINQRFGNIKRNVINFRRYQPCIIDGKIRADRTFAGDSWRQWPRNVRSVPDADAHPPQRVVQILDKRLRSPAIVGQSSSARVYVRALNREQVDADTRLGSWPRTEAISCIFQQHRLEYAAEYRYLLKQPSSTNW